MFSFVPILVSTFPNHTHHCDSFVMRNFGLFKRGSRTRNRFASLNSERGFGMRLALRCLSLLVGRFEAFWVSCGGARFSRRLCACFVRCAFVLSNAGATLLRAHRPVTVACISCLMRSHCRRDSISDFFAGLYVLQDVAATLRTHRNVEVLIKRVVSEFGFRFYNFC